MITEKAYRILKPLAKHYVKNLMAEME